MTFDQDQLCGLVCSSRQGQSSMLGTSWSKLIAALVNPLDSRQGFCVPSMVTRRHQAPLLSLSVSPKTYPLVRNGISLPSQATTGVSIGIIATRYPAYPSLLSNPHQLTELPYCVARNRTPPSLPQESVYME